jgi:hypothetical protein
LLLCRAARTGSKAMAAFDGVLSFPKNFRFHPCS